MNKENFCKAYSEFYGEKIDKTEQITQHNFDGQELFEFAEYLVKKFHKPDVKRSKLPKSKVDKNGKTWFEGWDEVIKKM